MRTIHLLLSYHEWLWTKHPITVCTTSRSHVHVIPHARPLHKNCPGLFVEREETPSHSLNPPPSFSPPLSHCSSLSPAQTRRQKFTWRKAAWNLDSLLSYAVEMRISSSWALMQGLGIWSFIHHPAGWERPYSLSSSVSSPSSPLHFPLPLPFSCYPSPPSLHHDPLIRGPVCETPAL